MDIMRNINYTLTHKYRLKNIKIFANQMYINKNANTYNHYLIGYMSRIQRWFTLKEKNPIIILTDAENSFENI